MSRYNVLQALVMSFFSPDLYRDVAQRWGAKAFLYLMMLVALAWIPFTIQAQHSLNLAYRQNSQKIVDQIPEITIKKGKLSTPENRPYFIKGDDSDENIAVIDTSGQYKDLSQAKSAMLITETEVITQPKPNETRTYQIPTSFDMVIVPKTTDAFIKKYLGFVWIFLFVFLVLGSVIYRIIQSLIYAIIGRIIAAIFKISVSYEQVLQIAMVSITPTIVLATVIDFFDVVFKHQALLYFALAMVYLIFGIFANKTTVEPTSEINRDKL